MRFGAPSPQTLHRVIHSSCGKRGRTESSTIPVTCHWVGNRVTAQLSTTTSEVRYCATEGERGATWWDRAPPLPPIAGTGVKGGVF